MTNTIQTLFLSLLLIALIPQEVLSACEVSQRQRIFIQDTLPINAKGLEVHCKFGDENLHSRTLYQYDEFVYEICKGSVEKKLSCFIQWGNKKKEFDAFVDLPNESPILESKWSARVNGIHLENSSGKEDFLLWD